MLLGLRWGKARLLVVGDGHGTLRLVVFNPKLPATGFGLLDFRHLTDGIDLVGLGFRTLRVVAVGQKHGEIWLLAVDLGLLAFGLDLVGSKLCELWLHLVLEANGSAWLLLFIVWTVSCWIFFVPLGLWIPGLLDVYPFVRPRGLRRVGVGFFAYGILVVAPKL